VNKITSKENLEEFVCRNFNCINKYIDEEFAKLPIPLYTSVDIRESKTKFAPIDVNLYPAGFNNICALDHEAAGREMRAFIQKILPNKKVRLIGLYCESHTKNLMYLDHLAYLKKILSDEDYEVDVISSDPELFMVEGKLVSEIHLISHSKFDITIKKVNLLDQNYDFIVLNNDQSSPLDIDWNQVKCPVHPTPLLGWFAREKNQNFEFYHQVALKFCDHFSIDPDLIEAKFRAVTGVDYETKVGLENLANNVRELLAAINDPEPKVFVKASQGTYGMGISVVSSADEILNMNRKVRNKMDIGKNKKKFTSVLVQEGVETIIKYDGMPAEITIYLVGGKAVGGFMRANSERDTNANLNSKGMVFRKFCISELKENQDYGMKEATYSVIARLASLAVSYEINQASQQG
jgi:glutamate--cysteine ligase